VEKVTDVALNVGLKKRELDYAKQARQYLELAKHNIYVWCDFLGYELQERDFLTDDGTGIFLRTKKKAYIGINKKLPYKQKIVSIAHEMFHDHFHPECVAFRIMGSMQIDINEGKAELFGTLVLYPSLQDFETEDDFIRDCGLQDESAVIRLNYFRRTGR
jgi:Zn-dependent peptidase ImmA (M78 family)